MLGHVDEPLLVTTPIVHRHKLRALAATLGGTLLLATALFLAYRAPAWPLTSSVPTTSLYGVSGECGPTPPPFATDKVREAAKLFVDSLSDNVKPHTYYPDAAKQVPQWQLCTIVQQCLKPDYGTSVANLPAGSRTLFFQILAHALSDESYNRIMVQQLSNLLLGEMQTWAVSCPGRCGELEDPDGMLPQHMNLDESEDTGVGVNYLPGVSWEECRDMRYAGKFTLWSCNVPPRMIHHANMDTQTGRYGLGNVFAEPVIHARNHKFDFVAVYGSLEPGQPFGFRYSGHHFDLSFRVDADGNVDDLPTFIGHNPLVVPRTSPPSNNDHEDYVQWHNMAGFPQFPDAVRVTLKVAHLLHPSSYVPLHKFASTPSTGGLTLSDGKDITEGPHLHLSEADDATFEAIWALIDYTLEFARGGRARPEKATFRKEGRLVWTTPVYKGETDLKHHLPQTADDLVNKRAFFYVRVETDEYLYFGMINSLFTLVLENEPSNHLHSIIIPKSYLAPKPE